MPLSDFISNTGEWLKGTGPQSDVVISSRIRLARNLVQFPFLSMATADQKQRVLDLVAEALRAIPLTSALTVVHTPFGTRGLAFVIACGAASWSLDLRRDATIVYAIHGACFFVAAGAVPNVVYAMGGVAVAIFIVNGMRPNAWFHAGFHLAVDVTLHEVWRHMRCPASGLKNWMPR